MSPVLSVSGLSVAFDTSQGPVQALHDVSLDLAAGETVAVVGESGSGKSTLASCVNRLLADNGRITAGTITLGELDITRAPDSAMTAVRGRRIGLVPQDPMTNLNPVMTVGAQIAEALEVHGLASGRTARERATELLGRPASTGRPPATASIRTSSPAGCGSGCSSRSPSPAAPRCSSPTSRPPRSTSRCSGWSSTR